MSPLMDGALSIGIAGLASALGPRQETGADLAAEHPDWPVAQIEAKTGVVRRYLAASGQTAMDLAAEAAQNLFAEHELQPADVDLLAFVSQSPDYKLPSSACLLQDRLGLPVSAAAFDIGLGCSGFVYGLANVGAMLQAGLARNAMLLCADTYSRYIEPANRTCRPVFSDAASACWLRADPDAGMTGFVFGTDGSGGRHLIVEQGGSRNRDGASVLHMDGSKVFMFTMTRVPQAVQETLAKARLDIDDIDLFVFHQASQVVLDNLKRKLGIPDERFFINLGELGNTVSASIPLALRQAVREGRLRPGMRVLLAGFGVGLSWATCIIRWT